MTTLITVWALAWATRLLKALGVSKRYDVSVGIKRRAVALKAGGMAFALVQIEVYVLSRGLSKLSNRKQLREWGTISEAALSSSKRQRGAHVDKCEHSVRLAEWSDPPPPGSASSSHFSCSEGDAQVGNEENRGP